MQLLDGAAATGAALPWEGGPGLFAICGTFAGVTASLELLGPDGVTWLAVTAYTANGVEPLQLCAGTLRLALTAPAAATTPPKLWASLLPIVQSTHNLLNTEGEPVTSSSGADVLGEG